MTQAWTIITPVARKVVHPSFLTNGEHPVAAGCGLDPLKYEFIPLDEEPTPGRDTWDGQGWVRDVTVLQQKLWNRVKELRDQYEFGVVTTPYGPLQSDERSQGRITRAVAMAEKLEARGQIFGVRWRMADNKLTPWIGRVQLEDLALLMGTQANHAFYRSDVLREAIFKPGVTVEELDTLNIEEGWNVG